MKQQITGTTIQDYHRDLDFIIKARLDGDHQAKKLFDLFLKRINSELFESSIE
ncbi:TPA: hypothetical protein ACX6NR_000373 [Photobacterium damselae]